MFLLTPKESKQTPRKRCHQFSLLHARLMRLRRQQHRFRQWYDRPPRIVRLRGERGIVSEQRHEQGVPLHLAGERMCRDERIRRLEIGAGREHHHVRRTRRSDAAELQDERCGRDERR